jgi:Cu+-exporting ATPase
MVTEVQRAPVEERRERQKILCYHCGTPCASTRISIEDKVFCCEGCQLVYSVLQENDLCDYYKLEHHPGLSQIKPLRSDKYAYLDQEDIAQRLYRFTDGNHTVVTLYIPGVHCSSCMWLLEHLHRLDPGITESRLNFSTREVTIHFKRQEVSLRRIVELLTTVGYEPYISLDDAGKQKADRPKRDRIYRLGVAGFCFGNIMMMSFPEYLSGGALEPQYASLFRILNLVLSVPVFFYAASEFFSSAWAGLKQKTLNIDAPIALALIITYARSIYEIAAGTGGGYLDSMSGIVFFMLVGRTVQERTWRSLSFHRDYKAYFPMAVQVVTDQGVESRSVQDLSAQDQVLLHNDEIIPADAVVRAGEARIDYSFVTGEQEPVKVAQGQMVYAGGKQTGEQITIEIVRPVAASYLTSLWNHQAFVRNKAEQNRRESVIHTMSRYFTVVLFSLAALTALYWWMHDPSKILPSVSAMLIVACPCTLLLAATYTNGNLLRIFSNSGLFLRDATVIEQMGRVDHIVFDKTGTLTQSGQLRVEPEQAFTEEEKDKIYNVVRSSRHPYSRALALHTGLRPEIRPERWTEYTGAGIEAQIGDDHIRVGSAVFTSAEGRAAAGQSGSAEDNGGEMQPAADRGPGSVFVRINDRIVACHICPDFREGIGGMIDNLKESYTLSLLSGDNDRQQPLMRRLFGDEARLLFRQKPDDKLRYVESRQQGGQRVLMIGDGLNDAGALQQSNVGITLADDINNFTPSCDAILDADRFVHLPGMLRLAKAGRRIINGSFIVSILYNIVGLSISMQGNMNPMIAAILMPASTLSIVLVTTGVSSLVARRYSLNTRDDNHHPGT